MSKKILLCDDEPHILRAAEIKFGRAGFEVICACDGEEGWQRVQEHLPDIVVTDCQMPRLNGIDLAERIHNDPRTSHVPVIMLTGKRFELSDRELREAGTAPGWEFEAARLESGGNSLFQLCSGSGRPLVVMDESDALDDAGADYFSRLYGDGENLARAEDTAKLFLSEAEWREALDSQQRLRLEQLSLHRSWAKTAELSTQPTPRFHGNVPAFMAEVRSRLNAGGQVAASAGSIGELERLTDLCREYELPYLLGELEDTATGVGLAADALVTTRICPSPCSTITGTTARKNR